MIIVIFKRLNSTCHGFFIQHVYNCLYMGIQMIFIWFSLSRVKCVRLPISGARPRLLRTLGYHTWRQPGYHCTIQPTWQRKCKLGWMGLANVAWHESVMDHGHGQGHINLSPCPLNSNQIVSTLRGNGDKLMIQVDINMLKYLDMMGFMVVAPKTTLKPPKDHPKTTIKPT